MNYEDGMVVLQSKKERERALKVLEEAKKLNRKVKFVPQGYSPSLTKVYGEDYINECSVSQISSRLNILGIDKFKKTYNLTSKQKPISLIRKTFIQELKENNIDFSEWSKISNKIETSFEL